LFRSEARGVAIRGPKQSIRLKLSVTCSDAQIEEPIGRRPPGAKQSFSPFSVWGDANGGYQARAWRVTYRGFEIPERIVLPGGARTIHTHSLIGGECVPEAAYKLRRQETLKGAVPGGAYHR
jgi:hypothetical protein